MKRRHAACGSPSSSEPEAKRPHDVQVSATKQTDTADMPDFRIAIDFGTTFTTIAFVNYKRSKEVFTIEEFPEDDCNHRNGTQVPTEIWYSSDNKGRTSTRARNSEIPEVLYGYEVTRRLELPDKDPLRVAYKNSGLVSKPKLLLDDNAHVSELRKNLMVVLHQLKEDHVIRRYEDVIEHLLICFLKHTKSVLQRDHKLSHDSEVEVIFAVPVCWSARVVNVMSSRLKAAMVTARFGTDGVTEPHLFIVNEAEAAAMHAIDPKNTSLNRNECFILLDCGGGTTDVARYKTAHSQPLRLSEEVNTPRGAVCGSSDLNTRMHRFAALDLQNEHYLEDLEAGVTISNIIDAELMPKFERDYKRIFGLTKNQHFSFRIRGLQEHPTNPGLKDNHYVLKSEDMLSVFDESLRTIERLMLEQIENARVSSIRVDKVVLVGGFGDSPALKAYLEASLNRMNKQYCTNTELIGASANTSAIGVAVGALKRAEDKENGAKRIPNLSIGVYYHVPDDPEAEFTPEVLAQPWSYSELSQQEYIMNTIKWHIKAGMGVLKPVHEIEFEGMYPFGPDDSRWLAREKIFVSEECVEDYFTRRHKKNLGKTFEIGMVEFDVTHLQDRMEMYIAVDEEDGYDRFEVTLRICLRIIDRHMQFAAYWPANDTNAQAIQGNLKSLDISSAFKPGTA